MIRGTLTWFCLIAVFGVLLSDTPTFASADGRKGAAPIDVRADGAFGFDQSRATVLHDAPELRLSALVDGTHLFVQAVLWTDDDDASGAMADGRAIGDHAILRIAVDDSGELTADRDRNYFIDSHPPRRGVLYTIQLDDRATTTLSDDTGARGGVRHVATANGRVRVDTFLVPISEIRPLRANTVRLAYWGMSPRPAIFLNSIGFRSEQPHWSNQLPRVGWHPVRLDAVEGLIIDSARVPHDRPARDPKQAEPRGNPGKFG